MRTDTRRGTVLRRLAGNDPEVNEEWICDKSRFAFRYLTSAGRITRPLVRSADGLLVEASWTEALRVAARGPARGPGARHRGAGRRPADRRGRLRLRQVRPGRRAAPTTSTSGPARTRPRSWTSWPRTSSGTGPEQLSYTALEAAPAVLCVALEPEEEAPIVFLRLRKAARKHRQRVFHLGQWSTPAVLRTALERGAAEPAARDNLIPAVPGAEAAVLGELPEHVLSALAGGRRRRSSSASGPPRCPACTPRCPRWPRRTGARIGWVPRRAGERGALDAGAVPTLLPGGRPVTDAAARAELEQAWGLARRGAARRRRAGTPTRSWTRRRPASWPRWWSAGSTRTTWPTRPPRWPRCAGSASWSAWSCTPPRSPSWPTWCCRSPRTRSAPAATSTGRAGCASSARRWTPRGVLPDCRVLDTLAVEMDVDLFTQTPAAAAGELTPARRGRPARRRRRRCRRPSRCGPTTGRPCWPPGGS